MTIRALSSNTGLTVTTIGNLEADKHKASLPNLRILAKALGVSIAYLGCFEKLPENTLGQQIMKARLYHGLTKKEMAKDVGVDPKTLLSWEKDERQPRSGHITALNPYLTKVDLE